MTIRKDIVLIIIDNRKRILVKVIDHITKNVTRQFLSIPQIHAINSYRMKDVKLIRTFRKIKTPEYWSIPAFKY